MVGKLKQAILDGWEKGDNFLVFNRITGHIIVPFDTSYRSIIYNFKTSKPVGLLKLDIQVRFLKIPWK